MSLKKPKFVEEFNNFYTKSEYQQAADILKKELKNNISDSSPYKLMVKLLNATKEDILKSLYSEALKNFKDDVSFFNLGRFYSTSGDLEFGIEFLKYALKLNKNNLNVVLELGMAYNSNLRPDLANELFVDYDCCDELYFVYEINWTKLLCGVTDGVGEFISMAKNEISKLENKEEQAQHYYPINKLESFLRRLELIKTPKHHIRDWHFIQHGAVVLDYFGYINEEDASIAGGRCVALWPSEKILHQIVNNLKKFLEDQKRIPKRIVYIKDRDSEIIAQLISINLNIPCQEIDEIREYDLVVASDAYKFNEIYTSLREVKTGQTTFALNLCWLNHCAINPDVVGLMSQVCYFPWNNKVIINPKTKAIENIPPNDRNPFEIAQEIENTELLQSDYLDDLLSFYRQHSNYLKINEPLFNERSTFLTDSPIPGSRFI